MDSDSWLLDKKKVGLFRGPGLLDPNRVGLPGGLGLLGPNRIGLLLGLGLLDPRPVGLWFGLGLPVWSGLELRGRVPPPLSRHWAWERATSPTRGEGQEKLTAFTPWLLIIQTYCNISVLKTSLLALLVSISAGRFI